MTNGSRADSPLAAFFDAAPPGTESAVLTLSAALSLTDFVAKKLLEFCCSKFSEFRSPTRQAKKHMAEDQAAGM